MQNYKASFPLIAPSKIKNKGHYFKLKVKEVNVTRVNILVIDFVKGRQINCKIINYLKGVFLAIRYKDKTREDN